MCETVGPGRAGVAAGGGGAAQAHAALVVARHGQRAAVHRAPQAAGRARRVRLLALALALTLLHAVLRLPTPHTVCTTLAFGKVHQHKHIE